MTTFETPIGNVPKLGQDMHLVRWIRSADGWRSQTLLCTYRGSTAHEWIVDQNGEEVLLPRDEWAQFAF